MMMTKKCKHCGKEFTTDCNSKAYCSLACRKKAQQKKKNNLRFAETYYCAWCGAEFRAERKRRYCTATCRIDANNRFRLVPKKKKTKSAHKSIEEINALARAEGLTYGQYMAKYGYRKESERHGI